MAPVGLVEAATSLYSQTLVSTSWTPPNVAAVANVAWWATVGAQSTLGVSTPLTSTILAGSSVLSAGPAFSNVASSIDPALNLSDLQTIGLAIGPTSRLLTGITLQTAKYLAENGPGLSAQYGSGLALAGAFVQAHPIILSATISLAVTTSVAGYVYHNSPILQTVTGPQVRSAIHSYLFPDKEPQNKDLTIQVDNLTSVSGQTGIPHDVGEDTKTHEITIESVHPVPELFENAIKKEVRQSSLTLADREMGSDPFEKQNDVSSVQSISNPSGAKYQHDDDLVVTEIDQDGNEIFPNDTPQQNEPQASTDDKTTAEDKKDSGKQVKDAKKQDKSTTADTKKEMVSAIDLQAQLDKYVQDKTSPEYLLQVGGSLFMGATLGFVWKKATDTDRNDINKILLAKYEQDQLTKGKVLTFLLTMIDKENAHEGNTIPTDVSNKPQNKNPQSTAPKSKISQERPRWVIPFSKIIWKLWTGRKK